jgi:hypothetical protein
MEATLINSLELFTVTYGFPGKPSITERNLTREGVTSLMNAVLRKRGWGAAIQQEGWLHG